MADGETPRAPEADKNPKKAPEKQDKLEKKEVEVKKEAVKAADKANQDLAKKNADLNKDAADKKPPGYEPDKYLSKPPPKLEWKQPQAQLQPLDIFKTGGLAKAAGKGAEAVQAGPRVDPMDQRFKNPYVSAEPTYNEKLGQMLDKSVGTKTFMSPKIPIPKS